MLVVDKRTFAICKDCNGAIWSPQLFDEVEDDRTRLIDNLVVKAWSGYPLGIDEIDVVGNCWLCEEGSSSHWIVADVHIGCGDD